MALWGQGDPRWIVEERPDAVNVNNWHWTEKEATPWSKETITTLFKDMIIEDVKIGKVTIETVDQIKGEACINNRKAKLIYIYDFDVELKWSGKVNGNEKSITGLISLPNFSDENEIEEIDVNVTVTADDYKADPEISQKLKDMIRKIGTKPLRDKCKKYVDMLKTEFSGGVLLPTPDKK